MTSSNTYRDHVRSNWEPIGPPLRSCREFIAILELVAADWNQSAGVASPQALILDITQEIVQMKWPENMQNSALRYDCFH